MRRLLAFGLAVLLPLSAYAQDDDLLAPLTDESPKKAPKKKKTPPPAKKQPAAKNDGKKSGDDDMLESLVNTKTELAVKVPSNVRGAKLFLDGKDLGPVAGAVEAPPGEHTVVVKRVGYADFSKKVTIAEGKLTEVTANLEPVAGVLAMMVGPDDAEVLVDGKSVGKGSVKDVELIPGNRTITVRKEGMEEKTVQLQVKPGKDYPVTVQLKPAQVAQTHTIVAQNADRPEKTNLVPEESVANNNEDVTSTSTSVEEETPLYKRWYVWTGVAVVAAGVGVAAVAASSSSGKTLTESNICGGTCDAVMNGPKRGFAF